MAVTPDVLVIGGGIIGLLCARELSRSGLQVTLIDRQVIGRESSWAGGGILSPLYPWRAPEAVTALSRWSQQAYPSLVGELKEATGIDPEWIPSGLLISGCEDLDLAAAWCTEHGVRHESVPADSLRGLEPRIGAVACEKGILLPEVAQVRNPRLLASLRSDLTRRGVNLIEHQEVVGLEPHDGRVMAVRCRTTRFTAGSFLIASGAWSPLIDRESTATIEVEPVKGQMLVFAAVPDLIRRIVLHEGRYLIPRKDGHILVGSTVEYTGFNKATTEEAKASLTEFALAVLPELGEFPVEKHWAGLRPGTAEGIPFIGPHPEKENLYFNCGQFRNGFALAPASSRLLADLMLQRDPCVPDDPYRIRA